MKLPKRSMFIFTILILSLFGMACNPGDENSDPTQGNEQSSDPWSQQSSCSPTNCNGMCDEYGVCQPNQPSGSDSSIGGDGSSDSSGTDENSGSDESSESSSGSGTDGSSSVSSTTNLQYAITLDNIDLLWFGDNRCRAENPFDKCDLYIKLQVGVKSNSAESSTQTNAPIGITSWNEQLMSATASEIENYFRVHIYDYEGWWSNELADCKKSITTTDLNQGTVSFGCASFGSAFINVAIVTFSFTQL